MIKSLSAHVAMVTKSSGTLTPYYYHYDEKGSITKLTDKSGNTVQDYTYDAFGNLGTEDDALYNPIRYTGQYTDSETGLIYLRNRYYDSAIGRFTQQDPIKDGLNWYVYCVNDPVNCVDLRGLEPRYVIADTVNFRSAPGLNSFSYRFLDKNTVVDYTGNKTEMIDEHLWAEVQYKGITGWIAADYLGYEPAGGFIGPPVPVPNNDSNNEKPQIISGSVEIGTGLAVGFDFLGIGVEIGGKRYYEFSPNSSPTENMQFSGEIQLTDNLSIGGSFTGILDATTKQHIQNSGYAGIKFGNTVLGWNDLPYDDDIILSFSFQAYLVVGFGGSVNINISELWRLVVD